jgi:Ca2+-binding RTX toxin-like protein
MPVFRQFNPAIHTPRQLVGAILKGNPANSSIKVTPGPAGVIYQGDPGATSFYDGSLNRLNIDEGILLTSGDGSPPLQNTRPDYRERLGEPGDPDFTQIAQNAFPGAGPSLDATTLQFSFAVEDPEIEAPHVRADLLFGSDEFPEFSNTDFVDVAGFLVNGINYAYFDKGNSPYYPKPLSVTDRSLNDGNFIDNDSAQFPNHADNLKELFQGETLTLPIEYDGVSSKLVQITGPVARQNNTIKVGVSDTGDRIYDSGVFVSNLEVVDSSVLPEGGALLLGLTGTEAQNDLTGTDVNEFIEAGAGKDFIQTGAGNDIVFAGPGNDVIRARQGQNGIDGGPGDEDTFVSPASFGQTRFNKNGELLIANSPDNQENQNLNRLANVEFLEFEGRTVSTSFLDTLSITNLDTAKSSKQEGDNGQTEFGFIVERPNNVVGKMEFNYEVTGRGKNPANAADFGGTFPRGTITFTGNQSRQQITIDVAGDTDIEPDELFSVAVTNADGSTVPRAPKASATILNDDNQQTPPPENAIAEIGSIDNLGDSPQTIQLEKDFENPVVIAEPASFRGSQPATVRISDVKSDSFVARIQETENQDGKHAVEDASYFVVEAGTWELDDGTLIEAGELNSRGLVTQDWDDVSFGADFDETPTVFSQIQTLNGAQYADTRQRRTDANGFQVGMEEEERLNEGGHARENIGWVAMSPGRGQWDGNDYFARTTGERFDQTWNNFSFTNNIDSQPQLLAQLASYTGSDPANLRYRNLNANDVEFKVQEDQSEDRETTHSNESVSVLALEGEGLLTGEEAETTPTGEEMGEVGSINNLGDSPQTIQLEGNYDNPVVFVQPPSFRGSQPATVRISDVTNNSFRVRMQETENQDGNHARERASYFVMEAGTWELEDGTILEVGNLNSRGLVTQGWDNVRFNADFDKTPTVFSQVQTLNGKQYVDSRQRRAGINGFQVGMEEEERLNEGGHARENIGWLAVSPGRGQWDGNDYYARTTGKQYDQTWNEFSFTNNIDSRPQLLAQIASYTGSDPANLRYRNLGANDVELKVQEDQSEDRETTHANESVSVFALEGEGVLTARPLAGIQSRSADVTAGDDSNNVIADESEIQTAEEGEVETASGGKVQDSETADTIDTKSADEEDDRLIGNKGKDRIFGGDGNDTLLGRQGSDRLLGGDGDDELSGGIGRDVLNGGNGDDILTGGASKDKVVFDNNQEFDGELGVDEISDFDPEMDSIILGKETFSAVESIEEDFAGVDSNSNIGTLEAAIIYNSSNGDIIYNANGSEPGLGSGGKFATLNGGPELDADNFTLR